MVRATCGCLNIKLHIRGELGTCLQFPTDDLQVEESQDVFWQQNPKEVMMDAAGVGIEHGFLVQARSVGRWTVFHCLCCKMDTHAVPNSSQQALLANPSLVTDPAQISKLQQSERFSNVYKIVLPWLGNSGPSSPRNFPDKGAQTDQVVATIQQLMSSYLKKEEEKTEEKIQAFTEQQQAALQALETRIRQERNTLLMLLAEKENQTPLDRKLQSLSLRSEVTPPQTPTNRGSFNFTSPTKELPPPPSMMPIRRAPEPARPPPNDDILFDLDDDDLDHNTADPFDAPEGENGDSGRDEGISIPRRQLNRFDDDHSALAKSLPMRVPAALSKYRSQDIDIEDDKTPQNAAEMEASIKALARSVHGSDDSFWDLPRPRLNTLH